MKKNLLKGGMMLLMAVAATGVCAAEDAAYTLPFNFEPSSATIAECEVIDANGDASGANGTWTVQDGAFRYTYSNNSRNGGDDWIILPFVDFGESKTVTVSISMKAGGYPEKFELLLGQERTVAGMTVPVMTQTENGREYKTFSAEVTLPEDAASNVWALGIHAISDADQNTIDIKDIKITGDAQGGDDPENPDDPAGDNLLFSFPATQENFNECLEIDVNGDKDTTTTSGVTSGAWSFNSTKGAFQYTYSQNNDADDWLILPMADFGDATKVKVSFGAQTMSDPESFEVFLGRNRTVDAMTVEVLKVEDYKHQTTFENLYSEVALPQEQAQDADGNKWCLGFHATSPAFHFNIYINDIRIEKVESSSSIKDVAIEEAEGAAEYYNLQGIRLSNPRSGEVVIVRQGAKTFKTVIR